MGQSKTPIPLSFFLYKNLVMMHINPAIILLQLPFLGNCYSQTEEAPYTVVADHDTWEERDYPATRWVSTDAHDIVVHEGTEWQAAFFRLFNYIDGTNSENTKIPMTKPVSVRILAGEGPNCGSNFTMSFLVPQQFQESSPEPTDPLVWLEDRPAFRLVARQFSGFPGELDWSIQAAELYEVATAEGLKPAEEPLWTAQYDDPHVIVNRRNEVWLELHNWD